MKMLKIDKEKCIGCGVCQALCPEVFEMNEEGKSQIKKEADLEKHKECIREAINSCPVTAIEEIQEE